MVLNVTANVLSVLLARYRPNLYFSFNLEGKYKTKMGICDSFS